MHDLQQALAAFWGQFAPAYLAGQVPDGARFPYITFDAVRPDALGAAPLAAILWCRRGSGVDAQAQRAQILDRIAAAIPVEGNRLAVGNGFVLLERNGSQFQSIYNDPEDRGVIGGRTAYILRYFNA